MTCFGPEAQIVITGAFGFIGSNLMVRLRESGFTNVVTIGRASTPEDRSAEIASADIIFHLAGSNRPIDPRDYYRINADLIADICGDIERGGRRPLFIHAGSVKAGDAGDYGQSKLRGEEILVEAATRLKFPAAIYRLPNVFGKWCKPNYNSAVATFCYNLARGQPIIINDNDAALSLLYVDDLIDQWLELLASPLDGINRIDPRHVYNTSVGAVAEAIQGFASDRERASIGPVGSGLTRALYATYVAALPEDSFAYPLVAHVDPRGSFSEILKTRDSGQFSYFTAHPGVTRGGHYHHTKTEKFLVVAGEARFRFRHILTGASHELCTSADTPVIVETIPGWAHDIKNIGSTDLVALLWANEIFDQDRPDTVGAKV